MIKKFLFILIGIVFLTVGGIVGLLFLSPVPPESDCPLSLSSTPEIYWGAKPEHQVLPTLPADSNLIAASEHWRDGIWAVGRITANQNFLERLREVLGEPVPCNMPVLSPECIGNGGPADFWKIPNDVVCYSAKWDDGKHGERWLIAIPPGGKDLYFDYRYSRE